MKPRPWREKERGAAKRLGLLRYNTGKPCPKGHLADRFVSTGTCSKCLQIKGKEWKSKEENKEKCRKISKEYRSKNLKKCLIKGREWYEKNKEKRKIINKLWKKENPEARRIYEHKRRAKKRKAGGSHTRGQIKALIIIQSNKCAFCFSKLRKYHIDHIYPISRGGNNDIRNIQILCVDCNQRKHNKDPIVFAQENGKLL